MNEVYLNDGHETCAVDAFDAVWRGEDFTIRISRHERHRWVLACRAGYDDSRNDAEAMYLSAAQGIADSVRRLPPASWAMSVRESDRESRAYRAGYASGISK